MSTTRPNAEADVSPPAPLEIASSTWDSGRIELTDGAPTEDWGVAAAPTSGGPYPVVIVLHGNHPTCPTDIGEGRSWPCPPGTEFANHEGLRYLVDALAERGFVAIAPGINVQYTLGAGEPLSAVRTAEIAAHALAALKAGQLDIDPGLIDSERLVMIGHSVGGQDAALIAAGDTSFHEPVDGLIMLQPALNDQRALPLANVPSVVVVSECDGDTGVVGGRYVTEALLTGREHPAAVVVLEGANHNFTNTLLAPDRFPVLAPRCDTDQALESTTQQTLLADVVPELAHAVLADGQGTGWAGALMTTPSPAAPDGIQIGVVPSDEPIASLPGPGPVTPAIDLNAMTATFCPAGYYTPFMKPGTEVCHRPELPLFVGLPQTIALSWNASAASITLPLDAPAGHTIILRVVPDVADPNLTGETLQLRLSTPEGDETEIAVPIPDHVREEIPPFTLTHALVMWSTVELPAPNGASAITIEVRSPTRGSIQLLSLGARPN